MRFKFEFYAKKAIAKQKIHLDEHPLESSDGR